MKFKLQQATRPGMLQWKYINTLKELAEFVRKCEYQVIISFDDEEEPVLTIIDNLEK